MRQLTDLEMLCVSGGDSSDLPDPPEMNVEDNTAVDLGTVSAVAPESNNSIASNTLWVAAGITAIGGAALSAVALPELAAGAAVYWATSAVFGLAAGVVGLSGN